MTNDYLRQHFKVGDIVFFFDKNNAEYQYSRPARMLRYAQSWFETGDTTTVHVGLIVGINPNPPLPGDTPMLIIDSMPATCFDGDNRGVNIRPLVRNYSIEVFRLRAGVSEIDSAAIAESAVEIAKLFIGMDYSITSCIESWWHRCNRENKTLNEFYTQHLIELHLFDPTTKELTPNKITQGMNCSESVTTWYQLAYLSLSDPSAVDEELPDWIGIHAQSTPAKLHEFFTGSRNFDRIDAESTRILRFSGHPHPEDQSMAIIPYLPPTAQTPETVSWAQWFYNMLPSMPSFLSLWEIQAHVPTQPSVIQMQTVSTKRPLIHALGAKGEDGEKDHPDDTPPTQAKFTT